LLIGAVLFIRSLNNVKSRDVGYSIDRLGFSQVYYDVADSARDATYASHLLSLEARVSNLAGVEAVAFTSMRPKYGMSFTTYYPDADTAAHRKPEGIFTAVSPSFFATTGIKILRGSTFKPSGRGAPFTVIINEAMAKSLWPNESAIGRCIRFDTPTNPCATVIGVVQTAILNSIDEAPSPHLYVPLDNPPVRTWGAATIVVRTAPTRLAAVQNSMRDVMRSAFPGGIPSQTTMAASMKSEYRPWDLGAKLFTLFGVLALAVAAIGVYSSASYAVNQRTHEFGVRIALGARAVDVLRQVLGDGVRTILFGVGVGIVLALASGKLVSSLLYGIAPNDPASLAIVSGTLVVIAIVAAIRPAWRASRADPVSALRAD
jgi:predicted permease